MAVPPPPAAPATPPATPTDPGTTLAALVPVLQGLVGVVSQLVASLQASAGAAALTPASGGIAPVSAGGPSSAGAAGAPAVTAATDPARNGGTDAAALQAPASSAPTAPGPASGGSATFRIASFNTLGASHTSTGGNQHPTWRTGAQRTPDMIAYLQSGRVDVAGLQEFQPEQLRTFRNANTGYDIETRGANSIVWRSDEFRKVKSSSFKVPYFGGHETEMPMVLLEHKATGKRMWVVNIHNPANTKDHPHQDAYRAEALRREQALIARLRATGVPVYLTGDFNDTAKAQQAMVGGAGMTASLERGQHAGIDWVFGTGPMQFTDNSIDHSTQQREVSDHPLVIATTTI